jgi:mannose-6-phosphate isomerase-like protein (cupin superfamily)
MSRQRWSGDIEQLALDNDDYRRVVSTTRETQLVVMSLSPRQEIGKESHASTTQFIRIEQGRGVAYLGSRQIRLHAGSFVMIPAGTIHNIKNTQSDRPMKLYTLYSPPHHRPGLVQTNKPTTD